MTSSTTQPEIPTALKIAIGIILLLISTILWLVGRAAVEQDFHRLLICFAFGALGLGMRALFYWEKHTDHETKRTYPYYFIALIAIISSIFLGFHGTLKELSSSFFYFLSFTLFTSMGFIVRTVLSGLIK